MNVLKRIRQWLSELGRLIVDPTVRILPGQIAFFLILSLFPLIMLIGYVVSLFDITTAELVATLQSALPDGVADIIVNFINGDSFDPTVGISMFIGFILASNGTHAIILASNILYEFPADDFVKRRVKAIFLILILVILFAFMIAVLAYGNIVAKSLIDIFNLSGNSHTIYNIFVVMKWPITMILIYFTIKLVYAIAPDWQILSKNTTKGAIFTTIGWIIATAIFSYYVSHFANYNLFYGSLSSIVILMIWVYVISYILVIGIAINVKEYRDKEE